MVNWILYAAIIVVGSAIFNVLLKSSTDKITPLLGAVLLQLAAFIVILLFWVKEKLNGADEIIFTTQGVLYSVSAGIIIALVNWSIFVMYENSAPLGLATVLTRTGGIVLTVIAGMLFFQESLSVAKWFGIIFSVVGIYLLVK